MTDQITEEKWIMRNNNDALIYLGANLKKGVWYSVVSDEVMESLIKCVNMGWDVLETSKCNYTYDINKNMFYNKDSKILLSTIQSNFFQELLANPPNVGEKVII
jgi:hypothetical protein